VSAAVCCMHSNDCCQHALVCAAIYMHWCAHPDVPTGRPAPAGCYFTGASALTFFIMRPSHRVNCSRGCSASGSLIGISYRPYMPGRRKLQVIVSTAAAKPRSIDTPPAAAVTQDASSTMTMTVQCHLGTESGSCAGCLQWWPLQGTQHASCWMI
jgi:hypothetical protein